MNRKIKFRVWDKKEKKMLTWNSDKVEIVENIISYDSNDKRLKNYKIMQFTGVKDLYGKEIYEGDIVQLEFAIAPCGFGRYEIFFDRGAFQLKTIEKSWYQTDNDTHLSSYNICCVIGNIFENPELAK